MKISVVIPVYNVEPYLHQCIDQVLSQTYQDLQIILVDDGSTDSSSEICDAYIRKDSRIEVIHKVNGGLSEARNVGTEYAVGEYLLYLDSDDIWASSDFVEKAVACTSRNNADMVLLTQNRFIDDAYLPKEPVYKFKETDFVEDAIETFENLYKKQHYPVSAWSKLIRTAVLRENGVVFTKGLLGEDMDWTSRLLPHIKKMTYCNESLYLYRERPNSITTTFGKRNAEDFCSILEKWGDHWRKQQTPKANVFLGYYATLYVSLVYHYLQIPAADRPQLKQRIINLSYLLRYANATKSLRIKRLQHIVGIKGMLYVTSFLQTVKHNGVQKTIRIL